MNIQQNFLPRSVQSLPPELLKAQAAMHLPEVQEMLIKLSEYNLGIYMPHIHDENTGEFSPLPHGISQVEEDLSVSFTDTSTCIDQGEKSFVPVGWFYNKEASASTPSEFVSRACVRQCVIMGTQHTSGNHV